MTTPDPRPTRDKDAALVQAMFDRVAPRYDLANTVFSLGQDRHWRNVAAQAAGVGPGDTVLDVAAGTGALSVDLAASGAQVLALDFSWNMVATGAQRVTGEPAERIWWCNGDGTRLPLADASVDAVTIAFGLRNLPDPAAGLAEFARVTRPGGRLALFHPSGRAALAARQGRRLREDDTLARANLRRLLERTGWRLDRYDDGPDRFLAVAERPAHPPATRS